MMFPNNNGAILRKLTLRTLKAGRLRNIMAILAVVLTTTLFTSLFTIAMGVVETMQQQTMRQSGGSAHGTFKYLTEEQFDRLKKHPLIKRAEYSVLLGMAENKEFLKRHTEIWYETDGDAGLHFCKPARGRMPVSDDELAADTLVLDLLGVPRELGRKVTAEYSVNGKRFSKEFKLCGFWENDPASPASMMLVSRSFVEKALEGLDRSIQSNFMGTGLISGDVMFANSWNIEQNMRRVITDSGYSLDENSPDCIRYGVNWAYLSTNFNPDPASVMAVLAAGLLIIFTGYLIIYNIFQISVARDIRFYGLLKTIGATSGQIRKIIRNQALLLSAAGIPVGLAAGFLTGAALLPLIIADMTYMKSYLSFSPLIFAGSAVFSLATVWLSCRKPGRMAGNVPPVEAVRYTEGSGLKRLARRTRKGSRLYRMAFSNLARNRRKTVIVVISMSLSLILLNSVFTVTRGFDMDKFLSKFMSNDFVIAHANYFKYNFYRESDGTSQTMIEAAEKLDGVEGGGRIYYDLSGGYVGGRILQDGVEKTLQLYGMEDFPLSQLEVVEGRPDMQKLGTGNYIIEGLRLDDNGNVENGENSFSVGSRVTVKMAGGMQKEYEVLAKAKVKPGACVRYFMQNGIEMYLPAAEFKSLVKKPVVMSYVFDVDDGHISAAESFLREYTGKTEPTMNYESKNRYAEQFKSLQNMFLTVGGALSLVIGLIGILNFTNSILTGIIARRREFAMLRGIGVTDRQLGGLLMLEGLFYALCTILVSFALGAAFSLGVIRGAGGSLWFFSYRFVMLPLLLSALLLLPVSAAIPLAAYKGADRRTIVELLRETE